MKTFSTDREEKSKYISKFTSKQMSVKKVKNRICWDCIDLNYNMSLHEENQV